jgi:hypothetical protein
VSSGAGRADEVSSVEGNDADGSAGVGGVDHLAAADVDADVVKVGVEEDEIAWLDRVERDLRPPRPVRIADTNVGTTIVVELPAL